MITAKPTVERGVPPDDDPGDAELIRRSGREPETFALLFRRHGPTIRRYVARRIGPGGADDVLAETFLVAFDQRSRYDLQRPNALPWLYGIATNLVARHRRAEARQFTAYARNGTEPVAAVFTDAADDRVGADAVRPLLAAALGDLRPAYRDALLLVAWGDLSYEETAAALSVPVGTVRSRISRARAALRSALGGTDPTSMEQT